MAILNNGAQSARYYLAAPAGNTWQQYTVSLSALGVANATNFTGFAIQDSAGSTESTFYLDDIQLDAVVPPPTLVHLTINAGQPLRTADARWFGLNAAMWDTNYDTPTTVSLLNELGTRIIRLPGGSLSDEYHWARTRTLTNTWQWATSFANFIHVITNASVNAQAIVTVNYGTGTPQEAAAWVAYCNAATTNTLSLGVDARGTNWQTAGYWASLRAAAPLGTDDGKNFLRLSRTAPLGFKYWEIGNECYGGWETDSNAVPNDPYTYAVRATNYIGRMKAVDPTIKIGVVSTPGEDTYVNNTSHPAYNSREGVYSQRLDAGDARHAECSRRYAGFSRGPLLFRIRLGQRRRPCCRLRRTGPPTPPICASKSRIISAAREPTLNCWPRRTMRFRS